MLSARVNEQVSHVMIRNKDGSFDVGGGPAFPSLNELVEHYKKNPMVETSGVVIHLKHPFHATGFLPANIHARVVELQKQNQEVYGKAGFWEEFEVSCFYLWMSFFRILVLICSFCSKWSVNICTAGGRVLGQKTKSKTDIKTSFLVSS